MLCTVPTGQAGRPSKSLTLAQADALLTSARDSPLHAYVVLSLLTGARTEEVRALRWKDVDLTGNPHSTPPVPPSISVLRSVREGGDTKTRKSRRGPEPNSPSDDERAVCEGGCAYRASVSSFVRRRLGSGWPGPVDGSDRSEPWGDRIRRRAVNGGSVGVIYQGKQHHSTFRRRVGWANVGASDRITRHPPHPSCRLRTSRAHRPAALVGHARMHPMHPSAPSLIATRMRKARAVPAHPVGHPEWRSAARAYAVEHAEVLGPLMADVRALLPEEHSRLAALPPAPKAHAVSA